MSDQSDNNLFTDLERPAGPESRERLRAGRGRRGRLRLARPGRFLFRMSLLLLASLVAVLLLGYIRDSREASAQGPGNAAHTPAITPFPTPTPTPPPTPDPTPEPAPSGYEWTDLLVVLDAGHGGRDPGTCSPDDRIQEKDITLDVVLRCEALLAQAGIPTLLTRWEDVALADTVNADLAARSRMANQADASLFVSIHVNSLDLSDRGAEDVYGMEGYFREKENRFDTMTDEWLATVVGETAVKATGNRLIGILPRSLAVLRETEMPATLLEIGYLSHEEDAVHLMSDAYRQQVADGVAEAIAEAVHALSPVERNGVRQVLRRLPGVPAGEPAASGMDAPMATAGETAPAEVEETETEAVRGE